MLTSAELLVSLERFWIIFCVIKIGRSLEETKFAYLMFWLIMMYFNDFNDDVSLKSLKWLAWREYRIEVRYSRHARTLKSISSVCFQTLRCSCVLSYFVSEQKKPTEIENKAKTCEEHLDRRFFVFSLLSREILAWIPEHARILPNKKYLSMNRGPAK